MVQSEWFIKSNIFRVYGATGQKLIDVLQDHVYKFLENGSFLGFLATFKQTKRDQRLKRPVISVLNFCFCFSSSYMINVNFIRK